jgi:hypothetical protein
MEDYRTGGGSDDGSDVDGIDFDALASNLQVCLRLLGTLKFWVGFAHDLLNDGARMVTFNARLTNLPLGRNTLMTVVEGEFN